MKVHILTSLPQNHYLLEAAVQEAHRLSSCVFTYHDRLPDSTNEDDLYISFLGDTIIPKKLITTHMYNTHPGPCWYPGWGSRLRTVLDDAPVHGATLHRVKEKVDTGEIIKMIVFGIKNDTPDTIHQVSEVKCLELVRWLITHYIDHTKVPNHGLKWSGTSWLKSKYEEENVRYQQEHG